MHKRFALLSVLVMAVTVLPALPALALPINDNLADATAVNGLPFADGVDISDATVQTDEPVEVCAPFGNTVWYALTLDEASAVLVDTAGSGFDTVLAVWQGTDFADLNLVNCVDDTMFGLESKVMISAEAGQTYLIQAGAFGSAPAGATLSITIGEPPKSTGKPVVFKGSFKGNMAQANQDNFDGTGYTSTGVTLTEGRSKYDRGKPYKFAELNVYQYRESYDEAAGTYTWESRYGFAGLEAGEYQLDAKLRSAGVDSTVTLFGESCVEGPYVETEDGYYYEVTCTELEPIDVSASVTWTGQGPTYKYTYAQRSSSSDGYRGSYVDRSTARDAAVAGSIAGDGLDLDLGGSYGTLMQNSNRNMTVYRGFLAY